MARRAVSDLSDTASSTTARKRRKARPQLNCRECRRLKMKCDRQVPCNNCSRRMCTDLCVWDNPPGGHASRSEPTGGKGGVPTEAKADIEDRLAQLERLLLSREKENAPEQPAVGGTRQHGQARDHLGLSVDPHISSNIHHPNVQSAGLLSALPRSSSFDPVQTVPRGAQEVLGESVMTDRGRSSIVIPKPVHPASCSDGGEAANHSLHHSHGTLVISQTGRSKYLGWTAASEWLKNQGNDHDQTAEYTSRAASPVQSPDQETGSEAAEFPFSSRQISTTSLLARLPPYAEGRRMVDCYYRHFSWHYNLVIFSDLMEQFERAYRFVDGSATSADVKPESLALIFSVLSLGCHFDLELEITDTMADTYASLGQTALSKAEFLSYNTVTGVQALFNLSHVLLNRRTSMDGDDVWPLWGLTGKALQAMGLHRDGERWNLSSKAVDERRRVFWELFACDAAQSNCFSRPGSISLDYIDTQFPAASLTVFDQFHRSRYEFSILFARVLDHCMKVHTPPFEHVMALHTQITEFEKALPFPLRCRSVLGTLPSVYPTPSQAFEDSPPVDRRDLQTTFQQFTLAVNIAELLVVLHRPYFARAVHDDTLQDPSQSLFALSYLTVIERCNAMLVAASELHRLYPQPATRHWWIWYHAFDAGACMGILLLKRPYNLLASLALGLVDQAIALFSSLQTANHSRRATKNLKWLRHLRCKIDIKLIPTPGRDGFGMGSGTDDGKLDDDEDGVDLLSWRTRLIERGRRNAEGANDPSSVGRMVNDSPSEYSLDITGDQLLSQLLEPVQAANWWNLA